MMFQMFSRNNDTSGNPYRLILVYDKDGVVVRRIEARSSSPNIINWELAKTMPQLPSVHVAPAEYKLLKDSFDHLPLEKDL